MKPKHQRLILGLIAATAIAGAGVLALSGLSDKASYFYTPSDLAKEKPAADRMVRLGGMVADKSIQRAPDGVTLRFLVTDSVATTPVIFRDIPPNLFAENAGVVAEGKMGADGVFVADKLLAKHDERYMPPEVAGKMHKTGTVSK